MKNWNFLLVLLIIGSQLFAQNQESTPLKLNSIGFVPQYATVGGIRIDYDRRISTTSNQWIIISPQFYMGTNGRFDHNDIKEMLGFGMDIKHRVFITNNMQQPKGLYLQYGPMYQRYNIVENRYISKSYIENGVEYFTASREDVKVRLNKFGGNVHLGYQFVIASRAYIDLYLGTGIRVSFDNIKEGFSTWYDNYWIDYGYSGTLMDAGFRIGLCF